ncbi:MAG: hypothetical protein ACK5H1_10495 [Tenacibaculum sp.]
MLYNQVKLNQVKVILLLLWASLLAGCNTKSITQLEEETFSLEDPFQKKITSFKVTNTPEPINAVISDLRQEITLVLPYYLGLTAVELDIQTAEGFSIVDKPENKLIEDVTPYLLGKQENLTYTLNDSKGKTYHYQLVLETYQPEISVSELYEGNTILEYIYAPDLFINSIRIEAQGLIERINGIEISKILIINAKGEAFEFDNIKTTDSNIKGDFPNNLELGEYHIRVENYSKAHNLQNPIRLIGLR